MGHVKISRAACCLVAGCTTADPPKFVWGLKQEGGSAALIYGEYQSANIGYSLECPRQSGLLEISAWGHDPPPGGVLSFASRLTLHAAGESFELPATGQVTEVGDGETIISARLTEPGRLLDALRRARRFRVVTYEGRGEAPTPPPELLESFARVCAIRGNDKN